jgi:membrane protease YdiL (CAAX protease family)
VTVPALPAGPTTGARGPSGSSTVPESVLSQPGLAVGSATLLMGLFVLRPLLNRPHTNPSGPLVGLFAVLLVVGVAWPTSRAAQPGAARAGRAPVAGRWAVALGLGVATFALGRVLGRGTPPLPFAWRVLAINSLAAVAEEAFFRRFVYSLLLPSGVGWAIVGSAAFFAVAHVTVYGFWVLPLDIAAGLLLSWQRWATGSWAVPAATHVVANVLMLW